MQHCGAGVSNRPYLPDRLASALNENESGGNGAFAAGDVASSKRR